MITDDQLRRGMAVLRAEVGGTSDARVHRVLADVATGGVGTARTLLRPAAALWALHPDWAADPILVGRWIGRAAFVRRFGPAPGTDAFDIVARRTTARHQRRREGGVAR